MKIFLVGFMGVGKTTIGKIVANKLNCKFIDTDKEIENVTKMKISDIFAKFGENHFRGLETNLLNNIINGKKDIIVATGGGMPIFNNNIKIMKENGMTIWLKADEKKILNNLKKDNTRPLLNNDNKEELIKKMLVDRSDVYNLADYTINVNEKSIEELVEEVLGVIKSEVY